MRRTFSALVLLAVAAILGPAALAVAQEQPTLAELAKREAERRSAVGKPARVYTSKDVKPVKPPTPAPTATADGEVTQAAKTPDAPPADKPADSGADAQRALAMRTEVTRLEAELQAAQARVNTLTADWVGAPDEASRNAIRAQREQVARDTDQLRQDIESKRKAISDFETSLLKQAAKLQGQPK